jgi:hypothetical protein
VPLQLHQEALPGRLENNADYLFAVLPQVNLVKAKQWLLQP